jgi:hypothetical protein
MTPEMEPTRARPSDTAALFQAARPVAPRVWRRGEHGAPCRVFVSEPIVDEELPRRNASCGSPRGRPREGDSCANCYYYLEPEEDLAFCWHEKLQTLVAAQWWCHYWEMTEAS